MKTPDLNRNTLSKAERLSGKAVISRLLKAGVHGRTSGLKYCFFDGNGLTYNRILLSVPKRRFKRAVMRNLLKRRLREAYRTRKGLIGRTGIDFMLCYEAAEAASFDRIRAAVEVALKEIGRRAGEKAAGKGKRRNGTGSEKAVEAGKAEEEGNRRIGTDRNAGLDGKNEGTKRVGTERNTGEVGPVGESGTNHTPGTGITPEMGITTGTDSTTRTNNVTKTDNETKTDDTPGTGIAAGTDHAPGTDRKKPASRLKAIFSAPFILLIKFYQVCLSPYKPPSCRFTPTCSQYAIEAFRKWGPFKGFYLTVRRLLRCHPWGGSGYDPVP